MHFKSNRAQENWLRQAHAQVRQSALLAEGLAKDQASSYAPVLANCQKRFYALCRQSDASLARMERGSIRTGLEERWSRLREDNVQNARASEFEETRQLADKNPWPAPEKMHAAFLAPAEGRAIEWWLPDQFPFPNIAAVAQAELDRQTSQRLEELLLLGALALFLISLLPGPFVAAGRLWPEALLLAGVAGSLTWGLSLIGLALMTLGALVRIVWILAWLPALLRKWLAAETPQHAHVVGSSS